MKQTTKNLLKKAFNYKGIYKHYVYKIISRNAKINVIEAKTLFNIKNMNINEKILYIELVKKYNLG